MNDLERISDLCLNYKSPEMRFNELADQIRILQLEVKLLTERLESAEQYKKALEML